MGMFKPALVLLLIVVSVGLVAAVSTGTSSRTSILTQVSSSGGMLSGTVVDASGVPLRDVAVDLLGVTCHGELVRLIERQRERGIFLSVLGVGTDNLKDSMMEGLAPRSSPWQRT